MTKALIHISDKRQAHRVMKMLSTFGLSPKVVHWRVSRQDSDGRVSDVGTPNLGLYVQEDQVEALMMRLSMIGAELLVLKHDPVNHHAVDKNRVMDKYVVVANMPPKPKALGIVDTENNEFVTLMDFSELPDVERKIAEMEAVSCLQFMANELNRLHQEIQALLEIGPPKFA